MMLSFLDNVGVFEAEVDSEGNFNEKVWEWKINSVFSGNVWNVYRMICNLHL
jgi:hypothetical protein